MGVVLVGLASEISQDNMKKWIWRRVRIGESNEWRTFHSLIFLIPLGDYTVFLIWGVPSAHSPFISKKRDRLIYLEIKRQRRKGVERLSGFNYHDQRPTCEESHHSVWLSLRDEYNLDLSPEGFEQAWVYMIEGLATPTSTYVEGVVGARRDLVISMVPIHCWRPWRWCLLKRR